MVGFGRARDNLNLISPCFFEYSVFFGFGFNAHRDLVANVSVWFLVWKHLDSCFRDFKLHRKLEPGALAAEE